MHRPSTGSKQFGGIDPSDKREVSLAQIRRYEPTISPNLAFRLKPLAITGPFPQQITNLMLAGGPV
jgi:hypothetical protein